MFLINVPIALIGFVAAAALLPEFSAAEHPGLDLIGIGASVIGLATVTYGLIRAGADGWSNPVALLTIVVGVAIVIGFLAWEHRLTRDRDGQPLLDMTLFSSASFTWGSILAALSFLALIGVLFTLPQYFQGVLGTTAMGSGLRLLPLVGGVLLGAIPAALSLPNGWEPRWPLPPDSFFSQRACVLVLQQDGASSEAFVATWMVVVGAGMGLALATSTSAALVELSPERSGVGSGVLEAIDEVGGPLGIAILGSVVSAGYVAHLDLSALSGPLAATVRQSVFAGIAVGQKVHSPQLIESVRDAFVHGMQLAFLVSAGISIVGTVLTVIFLPQSNASMVAEASRRDADLVRPTRSAPITQRHNSPLHCLELTRC